MRASRPTRITVTFIGILALAVLSAFGGVAIEIYSSSGRIPTAGASYPSKRIRNLIWPTVGFPAIAAPGGTIDMEMDPGGFKGMPLEETAQWRATLSAGREELSGLSYSLRSVREWRGPSSHWPLGTGYGGFDVWHIQFEVPADAVPELYDLTVESMAGNLGVAGYQRNSVSIREERDSFTFVSLADIHVHRKGVSGLLSAQTDKGIEGEATPVFFENAIDQVNIIRPDFVVMLGDFVRAQNSPGDYQVEFENFYSSLERLQVPAFAVPGNHDLYVNEVDGATVWEENLGPLYYSFDVGEAHFTCVNSYQWHFADRIIMEKLGGLVAYPRKWQGQVLSAADESEPATYSGQLAWVRDDLEANREAGPKFILLHHSPYTPDGEGWAYQDETFAGVFDLGGGGSGRTALLELASRNEVDMVLAGHLHRDDLGAAPWGSSRGETVYSTQTCVYFDEGGVQEKYPGYRLFNVEGGRVEGYAYVDERHSYPFYDGVSLEGETDLDRLHTPALSLEPAAAEGSPASWEVTSYLASPMELKGLIATIALERPEEVSAISVENGTIYRMISPGDPARAVVYVSTIVPAGVPGDPPAPGNPARRTVSIRAPKTSFGDYVRPGDGSRYTWSSSSKKVSSRSE